MSNRPKNIDWVAYLKNFYVLSALVFLVWISFFDNDNLLRRRNQKAKEQELKNQETYYKSEIQDLHRKMRELNTNDRELEKFAREKYLLRKKGEDVYVIKDLSKEK
ncbi:septum formation initiator family protein [Flammeovirga pectinis]|uniref:Septum formation initiator family protein n=1 Tax=Flammeovirga pectinis TaxID=2494373 RepID=A0A3Q9FP81_9BACT|nr:septum formation initiator family protein [Flammeovirga pectinis]AZQ63206.1 septum formation initiator family protein [Flammeovirga pectinis]